MLQKELAKRLKARYDTKMDGNEWMEVSSDGIPLCRIKYNGQYLTNADQSLSDEYRSKIADIQDEISTVREYVGLYEHAPQMKAADVSDYRQLAAFGDTVLAATYSEKNGFMFCTWKQNADGDSVFWGDYSPNYEYERYASGETKAEIIRDLKRRRVKTSLGKEFSPNSLSHLLSNKRYIGVYLYKGKETPGGMPRILDDDLFYRVQSMMNKNKNAPARTHGEGEYLLTTKLFCGHCKEMMVGYGGTSKTGRQYHYYMCKNTRRKKCGKKIASKSYIEDRVVNECLKMLTEEKIRFIAKKVAEECAKSPDNLTAKALKKAIREADTAIENLWKAIEQGQAVEMLTERLNKRMAEKAELEAQLAVEENKKITLTEAQILAFLDYVCEMPADDVNKRRAIINIFVHSIYLYDDHFTLIINASKKPLSIDNIPLDDIETAFEGEIGALEGCSSLSTPAPP